MYKIIIIIFFVFIKSIFADSVSVIRDAEIEEVVYELIAPLIKSADIDVNQIKINIVDKNEINAFVNEKQEIYIYTGLIKQIPNACAFQAIIAHELGHVIGGHHQQITSRIDAEIKRDILMKVLSAGLILAEPELGMGMMIGTSNITQSSILSFTRNEERVADNLGVKLMIKSQITPVCLLDVFNIIQKQTGFIEDKINPNNINHPLTSERINNVKQQITNKHKKLNKTDSTKYNFIRAKIIGNTEKNISSFFIKKDRFFLYSKAINNIKYKKYKEAENIINYLIKKQNTNIYNYELLGSLYYILGDFNSSIKNYKKFLDVKDKSQIKTELALSLVSRNNKDDKEKAKMLCKEVILKDDFPFAYLILSKIYTNYKSDYNMMMYYYKTNQKDKFIKKIKTVLKKIPKNTQEYSDLNDVFNLYYK